MTLGSRAHRVRRGRRIKAALEDARLDVTEIVFGSLPFGRLRKPRVFLLGMLEFRLSSTTHFDWPLIETYDAGREFAHKVTLRHFEPF